MDQTAPAPHDDYARVQAYEGARSPHDALEWAHNEIGDPGWSGMCLSFVRTGYNLPAVYDSAQTAWEQAEHRHETNDWHGIPVGAPVFMYGSNPDGHVAFNDGGGYMVTTNSDTGYPVRQSYDLWASWGYRPQGWTEDLNGYYVCSPNGDSDIPDQGVPMTYGTKSTSKNQKVKAETWTTIEISDDGDTSLVTSPGAFLASVQLSLADLNPGSSFKVRAYKVDTDEDGTNGKRVKSYPLANEATGTTGATGVAASQLGQVEKVSGKSRRVRFEVFAYQDVTIDSVLATWVH